MKMFIIKKYPNYLWSLKLGNFFDPNARFVLVVFNLCSQTGSVADLQRKFAEVPSIIVTDSMAETSFNQNKTTKHITSHSFSFRNILMLLTKRWKSNLGLFSYFLPLGTGLVSPSPFGIWKQKQNGNAAETKKKAKRVQTSERLFRRLSLNIPPVVLIHTDVFLD